LIDDIARFELISTNIAITPDETNQGENPSDCGSAYFRSGAEWPLQYHLEDKDKVRTVRLCQNNIGLEHWYATLFNIDTNIPVYSAVRISRDKFADSFTRPESKWHRMLRGLCGKRNPSKHSSFLGNLDTVGRDSKKCEYHQPQDSDYTNNNIGVDRGHLIPNALMNQNEDAAKATFTLTNVSPQYSTFNQHAWNQLECMVRKFMEEVINGKYVWIIVGTYGKTGTMNKNDSEKNKIDIPEYYWHAFCYTDIASKDSETETYSWIYMQENNSDNHQSYGTNFMHVSDFSKNYYNSAPLFDSICQNPTNGYGPWEKIIKNWEQSRKTWNCNE